MDILTQILSNRAMLERLKSDLHKVLHKGATMKINDWVSLQEGFDEIDKQLDKLVRNRRVQMTLIKAQAGVKNNMRRLNRSIIQQGSNHVLHVVMFALFCFFVVYLLAKWSRR
ncbi:hypothetical protein IFM89_008186 [Coptis chinensis]|uniref:Uncharacterized protein n=1 Tax=Coptis chinensis TaxID=261450 RepID=A0A835M2E8_9MAGN|nr:hypothetical protein IFM89_008186 [Coptis chinensis]